jgi:hypothetical protein
VFGFDQSDWLVEATKALGVVGIDFLVAVENLSDVVRCVFEALFPFGGYRTIATAKRRRGQCKSQSCSPGLVRVPQKRRNSWDLALLLPTTGRILYSTTLLPVVARYPLPAQHVTLNKVDLVWQLQIAVEECDV